MWDIAFSKDPQQKYMYLADGKNERIYVMDRQSLEILTQFGDGGRQPGQFFAVHSIATDSKGNIYTTETYEGKRLQKFVYKGIAAVPSVQGVVSGPSEGLEVTRCDWAIQKLNREFAEEMGDRGPSRRTPSATYVAVFFCN